MIIYKNLWLKVNASNLQSLSLNDGQIIESYDKFMSIIDYVLTNDFSIEMGEI